MRNASGVKERKHYIYAGGQLVAEHIVPSHKPFQTRYLHKDALGSVDLITDANAAVVDKRSFDAWGKLRNMPWKEASGINQPLYLTQLPFTNKGYTGHENVQEVDLIHMNGRMYAANLGRFISADPHIQAPKSNQSHNRYSYVMNNPLKYTDPTGYFWEAIRDFFTGGSESSPEPKAHSAHHNGSNTVTYVSPFYRYKNTAYFGFNDTGSLGDFKLVNVEEGLLSNYRPGRNTVKIPKSLSKGEYSVLTRHLRERDSAYKKLIYDYGLTIDSRCTNIFEFLDKFDELNSGVKGFSTAIYLGRHPDQVLAAPLQAAGVAVIATSGAVVTTVTAAGRLLRGAAGFTSRNVKSAGSHASSAGKKTYKAGKGAYNHVKDSPRTQQGIKNAVDFGISTLPDSPPPETPAGVAGYFTGTAARVAKNALFPH